MNITHTSVNKTAALTPNYSLFETTKFSNEILLCFYMFYKQRYLKYLLFAMVTDRRYMQQHENLENFDVSSIDTNFQTKGLCLKPI